MLNVLQGKIISLSQCNTLVMFVQNTLYMRKILRPDSGYMCTCIRGELTYNTYATMSQVTSENNMTIGQG